MSEKKEKAVPEHVDKLGRPLELNHYVAYPSHNSLEIGVVTKLNPKMVKVKRVGNERWRSEYNKYPQDLVVLDSDEMVFYILKNGGQ